MITSAKAARRTGFNIPPRVERIINVLSIVAIVLLIALIALWKIPSKYLIYLPATAEAVNPQVIIYLNRLSDLLFVLARVYNNKGRDDVLWLPGKTLREG